MKILQLGKFYPIRGGVEKVMWDLFQGLNEAGVHCDMLCAALPGTQADPEDREWQVGDKPLTFKTAGEGRCYCVKAIQKTAATMISPEMVRWVKEHKDEYDIIHVHHPDPMACLALRLSGYKGRVVLHWHSDILKQKGLFHLYKPLQRWLVRRADRIVGTTPVYVRKSPHLWNVQHKVAFIPIGIEDNIRRTPVVPPRLSQEKTVFFLGRLVEYKGLKYLVEAATYLPSDYHIVIGGSGPLEDALRKQIKEAKLEGRVSLEGRIGNDRMKELFNDCTLFCLPSTMKTEAFGIVQIEAMSCGKPVVATRVADSGISWVNEQGVSGWNAEPRDPEGLADAILSICANEKTYRSFCQGARERFEQNFTREAMIQKFLSLYEQVL